MKKNSFVLFVLIIAILCFGFAANRKFKIDGVWKVIEVQTVKSNGTITSVYPTESQVIFAKKYYSFCWMNHTANTRNWQLTDSVKLARTNQSIINAGSFELKDSILTTKANFAMNPMFVNGLAKFKCSFLGDTLMLTGLTVLSEDNIPNPAYAAGSYFVSKLVKVGDLR